MLIVDSIITSKRPFSTSGLKILEKHTDKYGTSYRLSFIVAADADLAMGLLAHAEVLAASLTRREQERYIAEVSKGNNPFLQEALFNTDNELRVIILKYFLTLEDPTGLVTAVPLLAILTDEELIALLVIDQVRVDEIRARALDVSNLSTSISNYIPPLEAN